MRQQLSPEFSTFAVYLCALPCPGRCLSCIRALEVCVSRGSRPSPYPLAIVAAALALAVVSTVAPSTGPARAFAAGTAPTSATATGAGPARAWHPPLKPLGTVPGVVKVSGKTAVRILRKAGYQVYVGKPRYDAKVPKDRVAMQVLKAGAVLRKGRTVTIYPSLGAKPKYAWKRAKASRYGGPGEKQGTAGAIGSCQSTASFEKYGIMYFAHKSMPFGTKVLFSYNGRMITAQCGDRGPYVGGREFDLGYNTAAALHFSGVDTVSWCVVR